MQELEFFTSEFCVQDPQLTDARIYGIPLAMQGDGIGIETTKVVHPMAFGVGSKVGSIAKVLRLQLASALGNLGRQNICQNDISLQNGGFNMV